MLQYYGHRQIVLVQVFLEFIQTTETAMLQPQVLLPHQPKVTLCATPSAEEEIKAACL